MTCDSNLISGSFMFEEIRPDKEYLYKYFKDEIQRKFLVYFIQFRELAKGRTIRFISQSFIDHTGIYCSEQWLYILVHRVISLEEAVERAEKTQNLSLLTEIKMGQYKEKHEIRRMVKTETTGIVG